MTLVNGTSKVSPDGEYICRARHLINSGSITVSIVATATEEVVLEQTVAIGKQVETIRDGGASIRWSDDSRQVSISVLDNEIIVIEI